MQIDKDQIGIESYSKYGSGGQTASVPIRGIRLWYPKDKEYPDIDISLSVERSQFKNKELAMKLIEKLEELL